MPLALLTTDEKRAKRTLHLWKSLARVACQTVLSRRSHVFSSAHTEYSYLRDLRAHRAKLRSIDLNERRSIYM